MATADGRSRTSTGAGTSRQTPIATARPSTSTASPRPVTRHHGTPADVSAQRIATANKAGTADPLPSSPSMRYQQIGRLVADDTVDRQLTEPTGPAACGGLDPRGGPSCSTRTSGSRSGYPATY